MFFIRWNSLKGRAEKVKVTISIVFVQCFRSFITKGVFKGQQKEKEKKFKGNF